MRRFSPAPLAPLLSSALALGAACGDDSSESSGATVGESATTGDGENTSGESATTTGTTADTTDGSESEGTTGEGGDNPALTYYRDIKPIVDAKCGGCHRPGDIAPFALSTYDQVAAMTPYMLEDIQGRTMPPWSPDAACRPYAHDRSLSDLEITAILDWVELGLPAGDPADEPPTPAPPEITYDVELTVPVAYTPTVYPDEYRCFLVDWPKDQETYITGFTVTPGERSIVHHVIAYLIEPEAVADYDALEAADPAPGYPCYGGPSGEAGIFAPWLGSWVPGSTGGALPEGTGIKVQPGSKVALQIHYHPVPGADADQSRVQLRTAPEVPRPAYVLPIANPQWVLNPPSMLIPAGAADVMHSFEVELSSVIQFLYPDSPFGIGEPVAVHGAGLHMHTLGSRASLRLLRDDRPDDPACLLEIPRWDFNWQGTYDFASPTVVQPNERLRLECHFDNSSGTEDASWGEGTGDEMCLGMLYVSAL